MKPTETVTAGVAAVPATPLTQPGDPVQLLVDRLKGLVRVDAVALCVVDPERSTVETVADWFSAPAIGAALLPALNRRYDRDLPGLVEVAIERGRPLFLPRIEDWEASPRLRAQFELHLGVDPTARTWELFRRASAIAHPVRTSLGRTLGVLIVASLDPGRALRRSDLEIVAALADLAALALERSDLLAEEASRAREELLLKRAAEATAGSLEPDEVARRVVDHARVIVGADHARLDRVRPSSQRLETVAQTGPASDALDRTQRATIVGVARSRSARSVPGPAPALHLPIVLGPRLFGVLTVSRTEDAPFGDEARALLSKLARIAAASLANAIDFERERRIARALTRGFVPESLPRLAGFEFGLHYEPADDQPTGGDVYGAWELPSGEVAVLIGDVAGKGVETAAMSAMARFFIEARSWDGAGPGAVLTQANALLRSRLGNETFVTAFLAVLSDNGLRYANAGHHTPLIVRAGGKLDEAAGYGLPLGIFENSSYEDSFVELTEGDLLFAYTDGLSEARRGGELLGSDRLAGLVAETSRTARSPDELVRTVHARVHEWAGGLPDDSVALALRRI